MLRSPLAYLVLGAVLMWAFLTWRGTISGPPWSATAAAGPRSASS